MSNDEGGNFFMVVSSAQKKDKGKGGKKAGKKGEREWFVS
jgi:hypothetical protein